MLNYFKAFSSGHVLMVIIAIVYGYLVLSFGTKLNEKHEKINRIVFVVVFVVVRSIRYYFDIQLGYFKILNLFSVHLCHISAILIVISLLRDKYNRFVTVYLTLLGFPAALSVVLNPTFVMKPPVILRSNLFILYHALILVGIIYIIKRSNLLLKNKDYYVVNITLLFFIVIAFIINKIFNTNYLYMMYPPEKTFLVSIYEVVNSHLLYVLILLSMAISAIGLQFLLMKFTLDSLNNRKQESISIE